MSETGGQCFIETSHKNSIELKRNIYKYHSSGDYRQMVEVMTYSTRLYKFPCQPFVKTLPCLIIYGVFPLKSLPQLKLLLEITLNFDSCFCLRSAVPTRGSTTDRFHLRKV